MKKSLSARQKPNLWVWSRCGPQVFIAQIHLLWRVFSEITARLDCVRKADKSVAKCLAVMNECQVQVGLMYFDFQHLP